nr:cilium assembly protein DZIP1L-like isoform X5 [Dermacentor andersoni]
MQQGPEPASSDAGESAQPVVSLHGFQFHSRCQKIDWRRIAAVDVDQVAREVDVNALQKNVTHLTFCDIDHELEGTSVDTNFVKLFKLAQLCIEYLMYSQDLLLQSLADTEEQLAEATQALEEERKFRICDQEAIRELQRENRKRRRIIENQQLEMLRSDRLALTGAPCPYCRKVFVSLAYLQAHVVRRHPDKPAPTEDALLAQWQRVATGTALPAASELHRGLQELRGLLLQKDDDHAEDKLLLRDELLCRLDELQRKCDSMAVGGRKVGVAAAGEASSWELSAEPPGSFSEGQTALASLSQQLVQQREEVSRLLAQQERLFLQRMDALSRDVVALTKSTLSVPVPAPRQRMFFNGKGLRQPPSLTLPRKDSRLHAKVAQSGPIKERHESSTESLRPFPSGWSSPLQAVLRGRHLTRQAAKGDSRSERMKSAVHSTPNLIDALKEEIMDLTRNKLSGIGINELGKVSVTDSIFRDCSRRLNSERRLLAKKNKKFFDVRHRSGPPTEDLSTPKATQGSPDGSWPFEVNSLNSSKVAIPPSSIPNSDTPKESFAFKCQTPASSEASPSRGEGVASSCRFSTATPAPLSSSGSGAQRPRRFLARSCRSRQPSSIATSHDLIKPLISSSDDDEGVVGVRQRNLAGATSSRYPSVASKTHPPPGRLRSSRPQTRITDLVQSIESQLLKRSARPPMGAVNTVSEGAHRKESEQKVEAAVLNSGDQRIATDLVGAARPAVSSSGAERKGRPPVLKDYIDDEESMEEVS